MRDVEQFADLAVGLPLHWLSSYLELLRREWMPRLRDSTTARLAGSAEFLAGAFWQAGKGQPVEASRAAQRSSARISDSPLGDEAISRA